jgi:hypothetical protein
VTVAAAADPPRPGLAWPGLPEGRTGYGGPVDGGARTPPVRAAVPRPCAAAGDRRCRVVRGRVRGHPGDGGSPGVGPVVPGGSQAAQQAVGPAGRGWSSPPGLLPPGPARAVRAAPRAVGRTGCRRCPHRPALTACRILAARPNSSDSSGRTPGWKDWRESRTVACRQVAAPGPSAARSTAFLSFPVAFPPVELGLPPAEFTPGGNERVPGLLVRRRGPTRSAGAE